MHLHITRRNQSGFTLLEVLIAVICIALMLTVGTIVLAEAQTQALARLEDTTERQLAQAKSRYILSEGVAALNAAADEEARLLLIAPYLTKGGSQPASMAEYMGSSLATVVIGNSSTPPTVVATANN